MPVTTGHAPATATTLAAAGARRPLLAYDLRAVYVMWLRDVKRFLREKPRVLAMVAQPLLYFLILGYGLGNEFRGDEGFLVGSEYMQFLFPGVIGMTLLFASVYAAVAIIWDREFGFMREILASPASRAAVVAGKVLGGSSLAMIQAGILLLLGPLWDIRMRPLELLATAGIMFLIAVAFTSFGIVIAPLMQSHEGFQVMMSFLVLPLFLLSGVFFPLWTAPEKMKLLMKLDPLTYGIDGMRHILFNGLTWKEFVVSFHLPLDVAVIAAFAAVTLAAAVAVMSRVE